MPAGEWKVMRLKLRFSLADATGKVADMGEADAELGKEEMVLSPATGGAMSISLRDMASVQEGDYRISVRMRSGDVLTLSNLGFRYEDAVRALFRGIGELEIRDLLWDERLMKQGVPAECRLGSPSGIEDLGRCEARLYETAMLVMPERSRLRRIRYGDVLSARTEGYALQVEMEAGATLEMAKLGRELDPLRKGLMEAVADLGVMVQSMIKGAHPAADLTCVMRAARLLRDGKAARRDELEAACPGLWAALEGKLSGHGIGEEYAFLRSLSTPEMMRMGMKRPTHAERAADYVFFLAAIVPRDRRRGGNALAWESSSGEEEGRATYFFRVCGRDEYPLLDQGELEGRAGHFLDQVGQGLNAVNFRREPIYLSQERLQAPEHARYRHALLRIPELALLRERFIGRVAHASPGQWKEDVKGLLEFNVAQRDDSSRWRRGDEGL